jgi:hypothetical protein
MTRKSPVISLAGMILLFLPLLMFYCKKPEPAPSGKKPFAAETAPPPKTVSAQDIWKSKCSFCHSQKQLQGRTTANIRTALAEVSAMSGLETSLSEEDLSALGALLSGEPPKEEKYKYITPEACQTCHQGHVSQWRRSLHALAHTEPVYDVYFIKASMDSDQELETFCASCHTPIGVFNGSIPFPRPVRKPGDTKVSPVESDGVQCDFCHIIDGVKELKNSGYTVKPSRTKFGPYKDSVSSFHDTEFSALHKSSDLCGTCHNVNHPVNGIVLEATYTEWKNSPYAKEGITCQDCHMTSGLVKRTEQPGKAALGGPERDHVSEHFFVGPNLLYAEAPGAEELKKLSEKLLKSAGKVEIGDPKKTEAGFSISVKVTNTGAGHYLPTGVTEIRQLWLEIKVTDERGNEVFHSGGLDQNGNIKDGAIIYFTDVIDETGASTTQFWNAVKKVSDNRIPPRETVTEIISIPADAKSGPATIEVSLQYRSVSPRGLEEVGAPRDMVVIPVFTISKDSMTLDLR